MGWKGESRRHSLSRKGIKTSKDNEKYKFIRGKGNPTLKIELPDYTKKQIEHFSDLANREEWIAELDMVRGDILIDDLQVSDEMDASYLRWNKGDESKCVGYIHYHPNTLVPEFSAQDFILAMEIHNVRENKAKYPYTLMGLVYPDENDDLHVRIFALNPKKDRKYLFEGKVATERDLKKEIDMLIKNKEMMKLNHVSGGL
ncbi:hypothetical protein KAU43_05785 [candidate division WOR-3 bacterium]|nr:hypothetical protein [candidate division WOR-3 bacterium]